MDIFVTLFIYLHSVGFYLLIGFLFHNVHNKRPPHNADIMVKNTTAFQLYLSAKYPLPNPATAVPI